MKYATTNKMEILGSTASSLGTDSFPIVTEKKGDVNVSVLKDKDALKKLSNSEGTKTQIVVDSVHVNAVKIKMELNGEKFQGVLQNKRGGYEPLKFYKEDQELLDEVNLEKLVHGDENKIFINQADLNQFLSTMFRSPAVDLGESEDVFITLDDEVKKAILGSSVKVPVTNENNEILRYKRELCVNVNSVEQVAKAVQGAFKTGLNPEDFVAEMTKRIRNSFTYANEERVKKAVEQISELLFFGDFKNLNDKSITSIGLEDLIALSNIQNGIVDVPTEIVNGRDARKVMMQKFINDSGIKIEAKAVNYLVAGRDKNSLPFFYESKKIPALDPSANVNFQTDVNDMSKVLDKVKGNFDELAKKHQANPAMKYAYLKGLNKRIQKAFGENKENPSGRDKALAELKPIIKSAIEKVVGDNTPALKMFTYNNGMQRGLQLAMMQIKGEATSKLKVDLVKDESKIIETSNGAAIDYSSIASPGIATMKFVANNNLQKATFGEDINIAITKGYKPESITNFDYDKEKDALVPSNHVAFPVRFKNYDYLGEIISKFDEMDLEGNITYQTKDKDGNDVDKSYEINVTKNVDAFVNGVNKIVYDKDGTEMKSAKGISGALVSARDDITNAFTEQEAKKDQIKAIKNAIEKSDHLQTLKTLGQMNSLSFQGREGIFYSHLNKNQIASHIKNNPEFLASYPKGEYKFPSSASEKDGKSKAGKAVTSAIADIEFARQMYKVVRNSDIEFARQIGKTLSRNKKGGFSPDMPEAKFEEKLGYLKMSTYVRSMANLMNAKSSGKVGSVGFGVNGYVDKALKDLFYPVAQTVVSNGNSIEVKTTNVNEYTKIVDLVNKKKEGVYSEIKKNIDEQIVNLRETSSTRGVSTDLSMLDDLDMDEIGQDAKQDTATATATVEETVEATKPMEEIVKEASNQVEEQISKETDTHTPFDPDNESTQQVQEDIVPDFEADLINEAGDEVADEFDIEFGNENNEEVEIDFGTEKTTGLNTNASDMLNSINNEIEFEEEITQNR